jgi:5-methylcytosine-specific restriction endonuclease McrA
VFLTRLVSSARPALPKQINDLRRYERALRGPFCFCVDAERCSPYSSLKYCMSSGNNMNKFCKKCDMDSERYADGRCKKCTLARHSQWAAKNRDKCNAISRKSNAKNAEKKRELGAKYRQRTQQATNEKRRQQRKNDPSISRLQSATRRARKGGNGSQLSKNIVQLLLVRQNGLCACCGEALNTTYHLDHIMPLSLGGKDTDDNVQLLLPKCNLQKYNSPPEKFLARRQKEQLHPRESYGSL